ncbi:MAG: stage III sporulation AC/AD family protein [Lachnospiraceae bacterium]|nr:stage III sporulation AC/AD family protein [Lachnospiraceae bacterium]
MDILKISILGIVAVLFAMMLKNYRLEYSYYISMAVCVCIFMFVTTKLEAILSYADKMQSYIHIEGSYVAMILKMIGVTYVAEFAANVCKDAGYQTIAGQIELFAKLSILVLSMPVMLAFMETIGELL